MRKSVIAAITCFLCISLAANLWSAGQPENQQETGNSFEGQTVNVLLMATGPVLNHGKLSADFEALYGVKVNLSIVPVKQYDAKVDTELLTAKGAWDVIWIPWRTYHRWIQAGWFSPMDEYLNDPDLVDEELLDIDGFFPSSLASMQDAGNQMALPILTGGTILYYRTDVFDKFGIESPPDTWKEFEEIAKIIHSDEIAAMGMRTSKKGGAVGLMFPGVLEAFGGSIVKDFPDDMTPNLSHPNSIKAAEYYKRIHQNFGFPGGLTAHWLELITAYQQGQIAMLPESIALSGQILNPEKSVVVDKTAYALIPKGDYGRISPGAVHGLGIPHNAPNKRLGYKYIEWILSNDIQIRNCLDFHTSNTTRGSVMSDPRYIEAFGHNNGQFTDIINETLNKYVDPYFRPVTPEWRQIEEEIGIAMSNILTDQEDIESAFKKADARIYEIFEEAGYYDN